MTGLQNAKCKLADLAIGHAANRLLSTHPDWAAAMRSESLILADENARLRWAAGCVVASYAAPGTFERAVYPLLLALGIVLMVGYQWSADESLRTLGLLTLIGAALGLLQPRRWLLSGASVGLVVAAVNGFETVTGLRPGYETTAHTLLHDARWTLLLAPTLIASGLGGYVGRRLRSDVMERI